MERGFKDPWAAKHDHQKVDLAFVVDCTGSMGPYIKQTQNNIRNIVDQISRTAFNVRMALVEYRDHPPQDSSFVTRVHDFTTSVDDMKKWVDGMKASGGGDGPEAVADALDATSKLSFRSDSTKMCVLIGNFKFTFYEYKPKKITNFSSDTRVLRIIGMTRQQNSGYFPLERGSCSNANLH